MNQREYRLAAIMFTDICGFSRMLEQNEAQTLEMLKYLNQLVRALAVQYRGTVIKTIGDAFLVDFKNTFDAVKCAIQIQHELAAYNATTQENPLVLRIGIHLGDIYFFEDDALGEGINIASRLQSLAKPGRICISKEVYNMVSNKLEMEIIPLGKVELKNITREIHAYEIITKSSMDYDEAQFPEGLLKNGHDKNNEYRNVKPGENEFSRKMESSVKNEEPVDFNELKDLVIDQIKQAGRRIRAESLRNMVPPSHPRARRHVDNILNMLAEKGYLARIEKENGQISYGLSEASEAARPPDIPEEELYSRFRQYRDKLVEEARKAKGGFGAHLISFLAVNGFLVFTNLTTSLKFPWFVFPMGGWGIGLITHLAAVNLKQKEKRDVLSIPDLTPAELKILRRIHTSKASFWTHLVSNLCISAFLFTINMVTSPGFNWFLFPAGALMLGVFFHWLGHSGRVFRLKRELKQQVASRSGRIFSFGKKGPTVDQGAAPKESEDILQQAIRLKELIITQVKSLEKEKSPIGADMIPLLDNYIGRIKELSTKNQELEEVIAGMPMDDLKKDSENLNRKLLTADSDYMKNEYRKSIDEIERQMRSFKELKNQKEVVGLRLISAVNILKQMQLDLARMKGMSASSERASINMLKEKSEDLSGYLEDLRESYKELE
ncbi:MAG: adenylate/guanylate cyclase domain-containing protein [Spirochaetota bacterium]